MKGPLRSLWAKFALPALAIAALLMISSTARDYVIATAHAAVERVRVVNRAVPTRPAERLFQQTITVGMPSGSTVASNTFAVPANRRLVLENIGGRGATVGVDAVEIYQSGESAFMLPQAVSSSWPWVGTTRTKVIFKPGNVSVIVRRGSTGGPTSSTNFITLTGYLTPI